ncbi:MAG: MFS transporter, partial [Flavobacteriaceae bacterium]
RPFRDFQFMLFWFAIFLSGVAFVQFIEILPLFYKNVIHLNEQHIGYLLAMNGFLIFLTEMPIVEVIQKKYNHNNLVIIGLLLFAVSFFILNIDHSVWVIVLAMILLTYGEIFSFPFSNTYAMERAKKGNQGEYMAFYALTFSSAFIVGPKIGMYFVEHHGFASLWYFVTGLLLIACLVMLWLRRVVKNDKL